MAASPSAAVVAAAVERGRRATASPTRRQIPRLPPLSLPSRGTAGQNALRPAMVRSAGRSVSPAIIVTATPSAGTGPEARVEAKPATRRTSIAATTVPPLDRIAGDVCRSAWAIASCLSLLRRSSSR